MYFPFGIHEYDTTENQDQTINSLVHANSSVHIHSRQNQFVKFYFIYDLLIPYSKKKETQNKKRRYSDRKHILDINLVTYFLLGILRYK